MKKVLIISYYAPPQNTASAVRTGKLMKYLPQFGWEPVVLSVNKTDFHMNDNDFYKDTDLTKIIRTNSFDPFQIINQFKKNANLYNSIKDKREGLKSFVKSLIPIDDKIGWMNFCMKKAEEIVRTNKIEMIFVSLGGINHTAISGYKLSKKFNIPLVIEFRDLWADHPFVKRNFIGQTINNLWERKVVNHSSSVITLTLGFKKLLLEKYSLEENKISVITNGFDEDDVPDIVPKETKNLTLTFCGNLYKDMLPKDLYKILQSLSNTDFDITLNFIGDFRSEFRELTNSFVNSISTSGIKVNILPRLPYKKMLAELQNADILLLFLPGESKYKNIIHAKFFDYLAVQKPMLLFGPEESEIGNIIIKERLGYYAIAGNYQNSESVFKQIISDFRNNKFGDFKIDSEFRNRFTRKKIAEDVSDIFTKHTRKKKKGNVLVVSNIAWNIVNFRQNILKLVESLNYHPIAVASNDKYTKDIKFDFVNINIDSNGKSIFNDFKTLIEFYRIYRKYKPKMVLHFTHKPNIYGSIAAKMLKIPCINNIAGLGETFIKTSFTQKIAIMLYKNSQKNADFVFFQNNDDKELFSELGIVNGINIDILPGSGIDTKKFSVETGPGTDEFRFLLSARMLWTKGVQEYVTAAEIIKSKYPEVQFDIIGFTDIANADAIPKTTIDSWNEKGIINFFGEQKDVRKFIAKSSCVVLPSYYREGVPRSLLEAGSMGKPIITTDNVGCKEVVDVGINGYLCKIKSAEDLSEKMIKMVELSEEEISEMGKKSRKKIVDNFDEKIVIDKYRKVITGIMKK